MNDQPLSPELMLELANYKMPFGKYQGRYLVDLPEPYLIWFSTQGFPKGKLGELMQWIYEIKSNGLEYLLEPLQHSPSTTQKKPFAKKYQGPIKFD